MLIEPSLSASANLFASASSLARSLNSPIERTVAAFATEQEKRTNNKQTTSERNSRAAYGANLVAFREKRKLPEREVSAVAAAATSRYFHHHFA